MVVLKKRPKRTSFTIQADIRRLGQRLAQLGFLQKHDIATREQLAIYRIPLEKQLLVLAKERHHLYRSEPKSMRIRQITEEMKPIRKEVKMCRSIEQHSLGIEKRLQEVEYAKGREPVWAEIDAKAQDVFKGGRDTVSLRLTSTPGW